jgi:hypothetical protein
MRFITSSFAAIATIFLSASFTTPIEPKDIIGAWGYGNPDNRTVMINTEKVFSVATYDLTGKKMISSYGGVWRLEGNSLVKKIEWNSKDSAQVGKEIKEPIEINGGN